MISTRPRSGKTNLNNYLGNLSPLQGRARPAVVTIDGRASPAPQILNTIQPSGNEEKRT
jgi:hypothetical protein